MVRQPRSRKRRIRGLTSIFADENDPFPIRFKVRPHVMLDFEKAIPIEELWSQLSFTRQLQLGSVGWAQAAKLRQSLVQISEPDGRAIQHVLDQQASGGRVFDLDHTDMRHIDQRTVVRTETGEVTVEVPEREEEEEEEGAEQRDHGTVPRPSHKVQAQLAQLGATLGFSIWIPAADRQRVLEVLPTTYHQKFVTTLPLNYDLATLKTIENIDVIWLDRRAIAHAFEVEHTTAIYSGLLRMADLLAMQPRMNIMLHIVAPIERRDQVRREIIRPVFSVLEGGAMSARCSYLSYDAIEELLSQPNLTHLRESFLRTLKNISMKHSRPVINSHDRTSIAQRSQFAPSPKEQPRSRPAQTPLRRKPLARCGVRRCDDDARKCRRNHSSAFRLCTHKYKANAALAASAIAPVPEGSRSGRIRVHSSPFFP